MALINPVSNTPQSLSAGGASGSGKSETTQDMFYKLLIAQLQNQDPLNPMESTEFTSQLAQFSELEKLSSMNNAMNFMQLYLASLNNAQAVDFIGKQIEAKGDSLQVGENGSVEMNYQLPEDAATVTINIYDKDMRLVRTIDEKSKNAGEHSKEWDGKDNAGKRVVPGTYTFAVTAANADGDAITAATYVREVVTGVTFQNGITYLIAGGQKIAIGDVLKVLDKQIVAANAPQSTGEKTVDAMKSLGEFAAKAAPIAGLFL